MSDPRGRFAAAALAAACLAGGVSACSEPAATVATLATVAVAPAPPAPATPAASTTDSAAPSTSGPDASATAPASVPTAVSTSVPPPPRSAPTRTSTPRATPAPGATPAPSPSPSLAPKSAPPPPPQNGTATYESQIFTLVNAQRSAAGLRPLAAQSCPDGFAEPWSPHMAAEGRLSHQSLTPVLSRCGARAAAENVGMNSSASPDDMVAGFMGSPPHRANILNASYTGIGIGAYRDAHGVWWVTQDFVG